MRSSLWLLAACGIVSMPLVIQADITSGLVTHWTFNETNGVVAADSSGNNHNASLQNFREADPRWAPGRVGGALYFNFKGNDDLVITDAPIDFADQDKFTFTFWLKRKEGTPTANPHLIVPVSTHWVLWTPGRGIGFYVPETGTEPVPDVWTHYAVVFDRAAGRYDTFVNGNPELSGIAAAKDAPASQQWIIGHNNNVNHPGDPWEGKIDDVRIYNRLMTASDVAELFQAAGAEQPYPPAFLAQPAGKTRFATENVLFTVIADGSPPLSYQWKKDGANIPNATESSLSLNNVSASDAGAYTVVVSNSEGSITSQPAPLVVNPKPQGPDFVSRLVAHWTFDATNGVAAADSSGNENHASLFNFATDESPWVRGRIGEALWFNPAGVDDLVITDAPIEFENQDEFTFAFWLKRKEGAPTANPHIIVPVSTHWVIWNPGRGIGYHTTAVNMDPPVNTWIHYAIVFNRATTAYQVYVDGALVQTDGVAERPEPGEQNWVIGHNNNVNHPGDPWLGAIDDVRIYNRLLSADDIAGLYNSAGEPGLLAPAFVEQPSGASKFVGQIFSLKVLADGTEPLSYQWKKDGQDLPGATSSSLLLTNLTLADSGSYSVLVSNAQGSATSRPAVLVIAQPPPPDVTSGLIAHWTFDETSGLIAGDTSGRTNQVTLMNFAEGNSHWVSGKIGGALLFNFLEDGEPDPNRDDLAITDGPIVFDNQDQFSFSFWLKRATAPVVANPHILVPLSTHWVIWNPGGGIGFHTTSRNSDPPVDEWRHYIVAFDRAASSYSVFVDGIEVQGQADATRPAPGDQQWVIGHNNNLQHPGDPWFGEIDDMRIYNRVLTATDVQALYQLGSGPAEQLFLSIARSGNNLVITWTGAADLQSTSEVTGPWSDVAGAVSPHNVVPEAGARFYRLIRR